MEEEVKVKEEESSGPSLVPSPIGRGVISVIPPIGLGNERKAYTNQIVQKRYNPQ